MENKNKTCKSLWRRWGRQWRRRRRRGGDRWGGGGGRGRGGALSLWLFCLLFCLCSEVGNISKSKSVNIFMKKDVPCLLFLCRSRRRRFPRHPNLKITSYFSSFRDVFD